MQGLTEILTIISRFGFYRYFSCRLSPVSLFRLFFFIFSFRWIRYHWNSGLELANFQSYSQWGSFSNPFWRNSCFLSTVLDCIKTRSLCTLLIGSLTFWWKMLKRYFNSLIQIWFFVASFRHGLHPTELEISISRSDSRLVQYDKNGSDLLCELGFSWQ